MPTVTFDLITEDPKNDEFVVYVVEDGPWDGDVSERLRGLQKRLYDALDVIIEGVFASKYPDSEGRRFRVQVDSYDSPPDSVLDFVRKFHAFIHENEEYRSHIDESKFVGEIRVVNGVDIGRGKAKGYKR